MNDGRECALEEAAHRNCAGFIELRDRRHFSPRYFPHVIAARAIFDCPAISRLAQPLRRVIALCAEREGRISGASQAGATQPEQFAAAYKAMRADSSIQFNFAPANPPPKPPAWLAAFFRWLGHLLRPVGRFLAWIGGFFPNAPYARILLWTVLAIAAAALCWTIYNRLRYGEWKLRPRRRAAPEIEAEEEWAPEQIQARSWLEQADLLAREGHYSEAIHYLLFRSVEDIARRRPNVVRPALTSRELAASQALPARARSLFAAIARLVERSLFGGRPVGEHDWLSAREAYANFALPGAWRP